MYGSENDPHYRITQSIRYSGQLEVLGHCQGKYKTMAQLEGHTAIIQCFLIAVLENKGLPGSLNRFKTMLGLSNVLSTQVKQAKP